MVQSSKRKYSRNSKPPKYVSKALHDWAFSHGRRIWARHRNRHDKVVGMSLDFIKFMRPIFIEAYKVLCVTRTAHGSLGQVSVKNGVAVVPDVVLSAQDATHERVRTDIKHLHKIVWYVVDAAEPLPDKSLPQIFKKFMKLCTYTLMRKHCPTEELRELCYFIAKNPIVFSETESMNMTEKIWNLWMMNQSRFAGTLFMYEMTDYIQKVTPQMVELEDVRTYKGKERSYEKPLSAIRYSMNVRRHFQNTTPEASLQEIDCESMLVLYDLVPVAFYHIVRSFWKKDRFFSKKWSLRELWEHHPKVLLSKRID